MTCSVIAYDLFSRVDMNLCYRIDKRMSVATSCAVDVDSSKCPDFELGLQYEPDRYTTLRAKISDKGVFSGCFKVAANDRMTMYGSLSVGMSGWTQRKVNVIDLNAGANKIGMGIDFYV